MAAFFMGFICFASGNQLQKFLFFLIKLYFKTLEMMLNRMPVGFFAWVISLP